MTETIDLLALWEWEFDKEFIRHLQDEAAEANLRFEHITTYDIEDFIRALQTGKVRFSTLLDRASDTNDTFSPVQTWALHHQAAVINPYTESLRTLNKSEMHYELIKAGVNVPFTVMLPSMEKMRWIDDALMKEVFKLPLPFVLKPAHGGGGEGVIKNVTSHHHVHDGRKLCPWDSYLAQERVYPKYLYGWRCWFRVYWNFGDVEIAWWDDTTLIYRPFSDKDKPRVRFDEIHSMMHRIAKIANLHFFSTEMVLTREDKLVAVDYINDQIDLRPKSKHYDGVPDDIIRKIARNIVRFAAQHKRP